MPNLIFEYRRILALLLTGECVGSVTSPSSVGSGWGSDQRPFREIRGLNLRVEGVEVLLESSVRPVNVDFALASGLWTLSGSNLVEEITPFNVRGRQFTNDGYTLSGAFGWRLRHASGFDQLDAIVDLLQRDPTSRRALAYIGGPGDLQSDSRDFPCASSVQFFLRDGRLELLVYMRSQSFYGVFPYDLINFYYLGAYVALRLKVRLSAIHFSFGSLHVYENEVPGIELFLSMNEATFVDAPEIDLMHPKSHLDRLLLSIRK